MITMEQQEQQEHAESRRTAVADVPSRRRLAAQPASAGAFYRHLIGMARGLDAVRTAVVYPVDAPSLAGALEAAHAGLIEPVLIGPPAQIYAAARSAALDVSPYGIVAADHAAQASSQAVALARAGQVEAIMKGALHTDELMHAVVDSGGGLRTDRRISHVFVIDAPAYPRPLLITDAAINVRPTLAEKRDIVQNAIDLALVLGIAEPCVAILSAVETVTDKLPATIDAAALCKMADRGQIRGGVLDGPLAFDNAVSAQSAETKGIASPVAGRADILVVPDLEAGNMLAKELEYLGQARIAGIVVGARVPIVLTSRADGTLARLTSCVVALLMARRAQRPGGADA
ncbi:bifunctional enoyl-CoA hydratase/phosphate acetyltransferase [Trinickia sp.]|uniref:bifunctional enoyl-CoA hydratase/phosphate acetyltransferase n=1 Tax=Trinickia sp. TaxID=2571163 RepID=UPI003F80F14A